MFKLHLYRVFDFYLNFNLSVIITMQRAKKLEIEIECKPKAILSQKARINKYYYIIANMENL